MNKIAQISFVQFKILLVFMGLSFASFSQDQAISYKSIEDSVFQAGDKIKLLEIIYDSENNEVLPESYSTVNSIAEFLKKHPNMIVEVGVHTDSRGNHSHNEDVSYEQAKKLVSLLMNKFGVDRFHIKAKGYGESEPIIPDGEIADAPLNKQGILHQINQRTELKIIEIKN